MVRIQLFSFITFNSLLIYSNRPFSLSNPSVNSKQARKLVRTILRKPSSLRLESASVITKNPVHLNLRKFKITRTNASFLMGIQDQLHRTSKVVTGKQFLKVASPSRLKFHRSVNSGALYLHPLRILRGELAPQSKFRQRSFFRSLYYRVKAKQPLSLHPAIKGARGLRSRSFNASYLRSQFISLPKRSSAPKSAWDHSVPQRLTDRRGPYVPSLISG